VGTTATDCDDHDPCTTDGCADASGCTHTPIVGCGVDSGVTDSGAIDSGTIVDSGSATDSGAIADSGTTKDSGGVGDSGTKKDSGTPGGDSGASGDGALVDGGDTGTDDNADVNLSNGCGCRAVGDSGGSTESNGTTRVASLAFVAGALAVFARRRRRA
jgi:MYXO-CTERM domain-containing protein